MEGPRTPIPDAGMTGSHATAPERAAAAPTAPATGAGDAAFERTTVTLMSGAHFVHDTYPAFVGTLLPLLIPKLGLSMAEAGLLATGVRWTGALQPVLGYLSDRTDARYWVIVTPAATAIAMSMVGIAPGFVAAFVLLLVAGASSAAFHPAAAATVTRASGNRWGKGTSYFMTGGELGRALGPLFIAAVVAAVGLEWSWVALGPGLVASFLLYSRIRHSPSLVRSGTPDALGLALRRARRPVAVLMIIATLRSMANAGIVVFLPTLLVLNGSDLLAAGAAVTAYEIGGTAGAFVGGTASDRLGRRSVLGLGLLLGLPIMASAVLIGAGPAQLAILAVAGFALLSGSPVQIALMHELLPNNRSVATGLVYLMTITGSIVASVMIGVVADTTGLRAALLISIAVGGLALLAVPTLPRRVPTSWRTQASTTHSTD